MLKQILWRTPLVKSGYFFIFLDDILSCHTIFPPYTHFLPLSAKASKTSVAILEINQRFKLCDLNKVPRKDLLQPATVHQ